MLSFKYTMMAMMALALVAAVHSREVEELGDDAQAKTGGFFSALQTSGSFTMSQAGGFEEKELGEMDAKVKEALQEDIGASDMEQSGWTQQNSCSGFTEATKKVRGDLNIVSYCNFDTATSCNNLVKSRTLRLIRKADNTHFMSGLKARTAIGEAGASCSLVSIWGGTAASKLYIDIHLMKTMSGTKSGSTWSWTTVKKCKPTSNSAANYNKFCDNTNKAKKCIFVGGAWKPNLMGDEGFGCECTLF